VVALGNDAIRDRQDAKRAVVAAAAAAAFVGLDVDLEHVRLEHRVAVGRVTALDLGRLEAHGRVQRRKDAIAGADRNDEDGHERLVAAGLVAGVVHETIDDLVHQPVAADNAHGRVLAGRGGGQLVRQLPRVLGPLRVPPLHLEPTRLQHGPHGALKHGRCRSPAAKGIDEAQDALALVGTAQCGVGQPCRSRRGNTLGGRTGSGPPVQQRRRRRDRHDARQHWIRVRHQCPPYGKKVSFVFSVPSSITSKMLALSALAKRSLSTAGGVVQVVKKPLGLANVPEDKQPYYGVVTMAGPPANAVDQAMVDGLLKALDELEGDKKVRGLVLTSGVKGFFTAGIDLKMFQNGTDVWTKYWLGLRQVYLRLYSSRLVSVAAINGHAPGAGTIFALACHYRFMLNGKGTIGLNEVALGLPVPKWISLRTVDVIGHRGAEKLLPLGTQVVADDAVKV